MTDDLSRESSPRASVARWVRIAIALLAVGGVALSLASRTSAPHPPHFDERRFQLYATNLAERGFYGDEAGKWPATVELRSVGYSAYVAPGYPFFLAAIRKIFGGYGFARPAQALLVGATVALTAWIAARLFGSVAAISSGLLLLATASFSTYSRVLLSEVLATATLTAAIALALLALEARSWVFALGAGLVLGASALVRPQVLLLPIPLAIWALLSFGRGKAGVLAALALAGGVFVAVAPWTARNYARLDAFVPVSSYTWITFWLANNPGADGKFRRPEFYIGTGEVRRIRALPEVGQDAEWRRLALAWVRANPWDALRGWIRNGRTYLTIPDAVMHHDYGIAGRRPPRLDERFLVPLALAGVLAGAFARLLSRKAWLPVLVVLYSVAFFCFFLPEGRFRTGILPMLAVLAGGLPAAAVRVFTRRGSPA